MFYRFHKGVVPERTDLIRYAIGKLCESDEQMTWKGPDGMNGLAGKNSMPKYGQFLNL